jgi:trimethylamine:corrinoid methyltransferase-like protein
MEATVNSIESFGLRGGLSREQIDIMHNRALSLVEEVGIQIPHDGILRILADYDGVHIDGNMVTLRRGCVRRPRV